MAGAEWQAVALIVVDIAIVIYWIIVSVLIISQDRDPNATLAWLLILFAVPFLGLVIYFLFGRNWAHNIQNSPATRRLHDEIDRFMPTVYQPFAEASREFQSEASPQVLRIANLGGVAQGAPVLPVRTFELFGSGEEYFDVLLADLASAKRFVHMAYFIWEADELTARITEVLLDRLAAGVEVRIANDVYGSLRYSKAEMRAMSRAGAHIGFDRSQLARVNYRNHRKITVVDGEIGHTGGFNVGQEYIDGGKRFPAWRDTGVRITGPAVAELEKLFGMRWFRTTGQSLFRQEYYPDPSLAHGDVMVQSVHQGYDEAWDPITRGYQLAISGAQERIMIQSPYFIPDATTLDVLINAAAGGVRVDFMTTSWLDKKLPWYAAESYFEPLLVAGARVWQWQDGFFHAKSLTVDGEMTAAGTMNTDLRSFRINKENMVWAFDRDAAARATAMFEADLERCRELTLDEVREWSRFRRFRNSTARLLSNLM